MRSFSWVSLAKSSLVLPLAFGAAMVLDASNAVAAVSADGMWAHVDESEIPAWGERRIVPTRYRTIVLRSPAPSAAPPETALQAGVAQEIMHLPLPGGTFGRFLVEESSIMAPALAARYPELRTYRGVGLDDRTATLRFDVTPSGYHAIILSAEGTALIDPYQDGDSAHYMTYFARDVAPHDLEPFLRDDVAESIEDLMGGQATVSPLANPPVKTTLRTYSTAIAATGEYTASVGGTKAAAMAAIVTILNRVNAIYEREVAVRLELVGNNDDIVYTNAATDPYTNDDAGLLIGDPLRPPSRIGGENADNLNAVIGSGNYDIGHVLNKDGGSLTWPRGVCVADRKAGSTTTSPVPPNHFLTAVLIAHEIGHQFSASHTFDARAGGCLQSGERRSFSAYEPGSGSTLMSYAGLCGIDIIQPRFDPYFHAISLDQINANTTTGSASTCGTTTLTGNSAPVVNAGANRTIPHDTPFTLTGSATDADGDTIFYSWEQFDLRSGSYSLPIEPPWVDQGDNPLFRSFPAVTTPSRTFPRLADILNDSRTIGEALPTTDRTMTFRLTARDNRPDGGGVGSGTLTLTVTTAAGPFRVTSSDPPPVWAGNTAEEVRWDVAGTDAPPVACTNVNILLSCNGGRTFPRTLAANTPNDGTEVVTVPNTPATSGARVKIECSDNVFFDISSVDFAVTPGPGATVGDCAEDRDMELLVASFANDRVLRFDGQSGDFVNTFVPILDNPGGLTFGPDGNLYVANSGSDSIRRFAGVTGELLDVFVPPARGGLANAKDVLFGPDANLYVISERTDSVLRYDGLTGAFLGTFVSSGSGGLDSPVGAVFGPDDDLFVSSHGTSEVLRYDGRTGAFIGVFVASGSGGLDGPRGLVFGGQFASDDNLYVASGRSDSVLRFDRQTGAFLDAFVAAGSGGLRRPRDLGFWPCRPMTTWLTCLHVSNFSSGTSGVPDSVLRYDAQTGAFIDVFVPADGNGPDNPAGLFLFNTNMYVGSSATNAVRRYGGFFDGALVDDFVASGALNRPLSLVRGPDGHLYASTLNSSVLRFDGITGRFLGTFVPPRSGGLDGPFDMAFGPDGNLYVGSRYTHSVLRYDRETGDFIDAFVPPGSGGLLDPIAILFGPRDGLYVASEAGHRVLRYDGRTGVFRDVFVTTGSGGLGGPANMVFGPDGNLYVSSSATDSVMRYSGDDGTFIGVFVASGSGGLSNPQGLGFGPDGLFVVSLGTDDVLRYDADTGAFVEAFVPNGLLKQPTDLVFVPIDTVPQIGNYDGDGDVDADDLRILLSERNAATMGSTCGARCDLDRDGMITVLDARRLVLLCTRERCATDQ